MAAEARPAAAVSDMGAIALNAGLCRRSVPRTFCSCGSRKRRPQMISASSAAPYGSGGGSELVDANMSVLRKRIHRLQSLEAVDNAPGDWMEWEKSCYPSYRADVAYLMAGVQSQLLEIRPSVALFIISVILSAMPVGSLLMLRFVLQQWLPHS